MSAGDEYKRHAQECLRTAAELTDPHRRIAMLEMAQAWSRLADRSRASAGDGESQPTPRHGPDGKRG